jgi:Fic family protein
MNSGDYRDGSSYRDDKTYLWQRPEWPAMRFDLAVLAQPLAQVSAAHGRLVGRLADVGFELRTQASLIALTDDVIKTSAIEGEPLDLDTVRSSIARRLGLDIGAFAPVDRHVDGLVEMVLDATMHHAQPLNEARLFGWHAALFPTGYSGLSAIRIGAWRDDAQGPMQVVWGPISRQRVHFEAPPATRLAAEMANFIAWANADTPEPTLIKAGLAHLWLVTLHPFDDGNGRIARAVGDLFLARADESTQRFYSLSAQIQRERAAYYEMLECTQQGGIDVTDWLVWFLATLHRAILHAHSALDVVLARARFWQRWASTPFNARQIKVLTRVLDGFEGNLTSRKWAALCKCSPDTALRDINELQAHGVLRKLEHGGRSSAYELQLPEVIV